MKKPQKITPHKCIFFSCEHTITQGKALTVHKGVHTCQRAYKYNFAVQTCELRWCHTIAAPKALSNTF